MLAFVPSDRRQFRFKQLDFFFDFTARQPEPPPLTRDSPVAGEDAGMTTLARSLALGLNLRKLADKVSVIWNPKLRTTAGRAYRLTLIIELNLGLAEISTAEVDRTLRHELAHLVAYARAGRRRIDAHGPEWRQACVDLGIAGEARCHDLPFVGSRQRRKWAYECTSCGHVIERVRRVKWAAACHPCCRKYNRGRYHDRFLLVESRLES